MRRAAEFSVRLFYLPLMRMRRSSMIAALILAATGGGLDAQDAGGASRTFPPVGAPGLTVLQSDARTFRFEFRPRYAFRQSVVMDGRPFVRYDFTGSSRLNAERNQGLPDVAYLPLSLAVPGNQGNSVRVVASDFEDIAGEEILPLPRLAVKNGMLEALPGTGTAVGPSGTEFFPPSPVVLLMGGETRGTFLAQIRVFPVQYNPATRTVRKCSRLVVDVNFGPPGISSGVRDDAILKTVVMNYEASRQWTSPVRKTGAVAPSVLASGEWYRLAVTEDGIYRLDAQSLTAAGINVAALDPRTIKIFCNGGRELPEDPSAPRPTDLVQNAIQVVGEADGRLDPGDEIRFYGRSVRGWTYDPLRRTYRHVLHHYSDVNYYWLTFGGQPGMRMADQLAALSPTSVAESFTEYVAIEEERVNKLSSGKDWYGQSLSGPGASFTHVTPLPGLLPGGSIGYRFALVASSESVPTFLVKEDATTLGLFPLPAISGFLFSTAGTFEATGTSSLANSTSRLSFTLNSSSAGAEGWIDWIEIRYPRQLWAVNGALRFRSPDTSGVVEYRLQQFSSMPVVFNVTDPAAVRTVSGISGSYIVRAAEQRGTPSEYFAAAPSAFKTPGAVQRVTNQNLRGFSAGADYIILTSPEFRNAADRLKAFREQPENGDLRTVVVDVNQVYNEFAGGLPDITGIRDYLKYAYENWTKRPTFVLFLGQGSYDYKGLLGSKTSFVPTWQSVESRDEVGTYATDDFFAKFSASDNISLVLGRINARSAAEADAAVDKVKRYETSSSQDAWKMRILYVGDDAWTPEGGEFGDRTTHSDDAETLANPFYTPDEFEKVKVYIAEYPTVNNAQGRRKPGAAQAIIDDINRGVLMVNYSGHGNPSVWAHERIFEVGTSIPQLRNASTLSFFILATCNFSQFDEPKSYTGSELLLNRQEGGGIAVVSASRKVFAGANAALNQGMYQRLFTRDAFRRVVVERPATALFLYKANGLNIDNDQKFFFMGDPAMRLQYPGRYVSVDTVNAQALDSVGGSPRTNPVQLRSLQRVTVTGSMRDTRNAIDASYTGKLTLQVNDVSRRVVIPNFYPGTNWDYLATGATIYRGENTVRDGRFRASFVVPKDIAYADSLGRGRLVAFVTGSAGDGAGYSGNIRVGGTDTTVAQDTRGPSVRIYLDNRSFRSGDLVSEHPTLLVDLSDSSGVNTSRTGIGHGIEAWVNAAAQSIDLTDYYSSSLDNFRSGSVQYPLQSLPQGRNALRVRAWDSYNNSSMADVVFDVASGDQLSITDVYNYPNPFANETYFTFRQNQTGLLSVTVKIFTVAGRLIRTLTAGTAGNSFIRIPWDGRDEEGARPANGVYLYKVIARTSDGRFSSEALGKLSILK